MATVSILHSDHYRALRQTLDSGLLPKLTSFEGSLFHGTDDAAAAQIVASQTWAVGTWTGTWLGPAVYCYENRAPSPYYGSEERIAKVGIDAATHQAARKMLSFNIPGEPAVVELDVKCDAVMDLESAANDEFMETLAKAFRAITRQECDGPNVEIVGQPRSIGKAMHRSSDDLPADLRPKAYRLRFPCSNLGMCWGFAIVDRSCILSTRHAKDFPSLTQDTFLLTSVEP